MSRPVVSAISTPNHFNGSGSVSVPFPTVAAGQLLLIGIAYTCSGASTHDGVGYQRIDTAVGSGGERLSVLWKVMADSSPALVTLSFPAAAKGVAHTTTVAPSKPSLVFTQTLGTSPSGTVTAAALPIGPDDLQVFFGASFHGTTGGSGITPADGTFTAHINANDVGPSHDYDYAVYSSPTGNSHSYTLTGASEAKAIAVALGAGGGDSVGILIG